MQHKYFALLAGLLLTASAAQAQITFGPRLGLNLTTVAIETDSPAGPVDRRYLASGQVGVALNAQFGKLAFQPAVVISQKGYKGKNQETPYFKNDIVQTVRLNYVEVPLNLVFTTGGEQGFQVFAGPYVALGLGGNYTVKGDWEYNDGFVRDRGTIDQHGDVKFVSKYPNNSTSKDEHFRAVDFGLNAGLGYKINAFQVQLGYGLGLANTLPKTPDGKEPRDKVRNRGLQLMAGYFFGGN